MTDILLSSLQTLTQDPATLTTLTTQGFNTIFDIANEPLQTFCQTLASVPEDQAEAIYDAASTRVAALHSINRTLRARNEPVLQGIPKLNIAPRPAELEAAIGRSLGGIVDFDDLFDERSSAYAEVTSIQSLFSPGRYLVELYKLAKDLHAEDSPLHIEKRRPDIKDLVLNENNLNKETSTLSILNEILLKGIQAKPGAPDLRVMETTFFPMTLPYHDNLVQVRSVLAKNKLSLQQLWAALADDQLTAFYPIEPESIGSLMDPTPSPATREQLKLAPELYAMLATTASDEATTKLHYGLASDADITTQLKSVDTFIARTGLTLNQLIEMTAQADYSGTDATINGLIDNLAPGTTETVTFCFGEDPGSAFSAADVVVSNATLGPISGTGTTRTATVTSNASNLLINGNFDGGATGWDIAGTVKLHNNGPMTFESGDSVDGVIQQTVPTVEGQTYLVQFWVAGHNNVYPACTATALALSGTTILGSLNTSANHNPAMVKFNFVAASSTTTIKLIETYDDPNNEYYFDDFVVACVPKVATVYNPRFWHYGDHAPANFNVYGQAYLSDGHSNPAPLLVYAAGAANHLELKLSSANAVNYCDRAQRLVRLQRKVNLPFHELDWLIKNANKAVDPNRPLQLDTPVLGIIAEFTRLSSRYGLSSDEFTCFIGDMNTFARQSEQSLFQRLFTSNLDGTTLELNATLNFDSSVHSADTAIVCGALKVSADELQQMAQLAFGLDNPTAVVMSSMRYAQLYRLAMIPRMLGLSFTQAKVLWDLINPGQDNAKRIGQANTQHTLGIIRQTETVLTWMVDNQLDFQTVLNMTTNSYSTVLTPDLYNFTHNLFTSLAHDTDVTGQPADEPLSPALEQRLYQAIAPVFACKPNVMAKLLQWLDVFFRLPDGITAYGLGDFWVDVQQVHGADAGVDISQASANVARYSQGMAQYALMAQWANLTEQDLNLIVDNYAWFMVVMSRSVLGNKRVTPSGNQASPGNNGKFRTEQGMGNLIDGGWVTTWNSTGQNGSDLDVYQQRFDANGMAVGGETRVNTSTTEKQCNSRVTGLANGGWVVTWEDQQQNVLTIYQQCFDASGVNAGSEIRVSMGEVYDPDVAALPGGGWIVVFKHFENVSSITWVIKAQQYTATGTAVGDNITVATSTSYLCEPAIATLYDGGWVVSWYCIAARAEDLGGIFMQAYNADGSKRGLETHCNTYTPNTQTEVDVAGLSDGGWLVAWQSPDQDGSGFGIYQQRYTAKGLAQGPENRVNTVTAGDQKLAAVCALTGGGWVVTWQSNNQFSATSGNDIYLQHFDANGIKVGSEELVNTHFTVGEQTAPNITATADGGWTISWISAGQDGNGNGVYQQHYRPNYGAKPSLPLLLRIARLKQWQLRTVVPASTAIGYLEKANQAGQTSTGALDALATVHGWDSKQTALMNDALVRQQIYKDFPKRFDDVCHLETWMQASTHLTVGSNCLVQLNEMSKPQDSAQASDLIRNVAEQLTATIKY
ncbi:hypothetical protein J3D48_006302 [Pseudomonas fluorescens]|uniref:Tc toxin subunit A n=1 Tax=Pseudomonas fluorescens TaxID=294 RepID=UPI0020A18A25|nr:Tc toxin subunit A [Pseudomonas fluorescens]MCP1489892.1 hypothetical protein [Pseudomonas fluorescens]